MKKLLTFFLTALLAFGVGWAAEETITFSSLYSSDTSLDGVTINGTTFSIEFNKASGSNAPKYYANGTAVRWYAKNTMTVSSTNTITSIVITFGSGDGTNAITTNVGNYSNGSWSGSSSAVVFTEGGSSGQRRIAAVTVTTSGGTPTCATPTFSPAAGTYTSAQNVSISCGTSGATIYYTTDGSTPTTSSSVYSSAIPVSSTTTIKAIATATGYNNSEVATATYTIDILSSDYDVIDFRDNDHWYPSLPENSENKQTTSQTFNDGTYNITLAAADGYYYSTSGKYLLIGKSGSSITFPAFSKDVEKIVVQGKSGASSNTVMNIYVGDVAVSTATTGSAGTNTYNIANAYQAAGNIYTLKITSNHNAQIQYITIYFKESNQVATPTFSPVEGTYTSAQSVTISCDTQGATIYYTTDGSTPTTSSSVYSSAINVGTTTTIKAIAVKSGMDNSEVATATYTINLTPSLTVLPDVVNINDDNTSGARTGSFTVTGANLGTSNVGVTRTNTKFMPSLTATTGTTYVGYDGDNYYCGFTPAGSLEGTVAMTYNGHALSATTAVNLANGNGASAAVNVNYLYTGPIYLFGNIGPDANSINNFNYANGVAMTRNTTDGTYSVNITAVGQNGGSYSWMYFSKNQGTESDALSTKFGPISNESYWPLQGDYDLTGVACALDTTLEGSNAKTIRLNPGEYTVEINPHNNTFKISALVHAPVISLANGTYEGAQTVTITSQTPGATIYYTTDGTTPTTSSSSIANGGTVTISQGCTLKAIAVSNGVLSAVTEATYVIIAPFESKDYEMVTNVNQLESGKTYLIVYKTADDATSATVMGPVSNNIGTRVTATESNAGLITSTNAMAVVTLSGSTGNWTLVTSQGILEAQDANNLYVGNTPHTWTIDKESSNLNTFKIQSNAQTNRYLQYNSSSTRFACYKTSSNQKYVYIYRESTTPAIIVTESGGTTEIDVPVGVASATDTIYVGGRNLTGAVTLTLSAEDQAKGFSLSTNSVSQADALAGNVPVVVTYSGPDASATATITLSSAGANPVGVPVNATREALAVTISPASCNFVGRVMSEPVTITANAPGATIEYSLDGGTTWQTYTEGITIAIEHPNNSVTVTARASLTVGGNTYNSAEVFETYTRQPKGATLYEKVTDESQIKANEKYIIVYEGATPVAFNGIYENSQYNLSEVGSGVNVAWKTQNQVVDISNTNATVFTLGNNPSEWTLYSESDEGYLEATTSSTVGIDYYQSASSGWQWNAVSDGNGYYLTTRSTYYLRYNSQAVDRGPFRLYSDQTTGSPAYLYVLRPAVLAPEITPATGEYSGNQRVEITAEPGVDIYYTTDGTDPTSNSTPYEGPFNALFDSNGPTTIKAIAIDDEGNVSTIASVIYTWVAPKVTIRPATRDVYNNTLTVVIGSNPVDATIYYTTDGTTPSATPSAQNGTLYEGPFEVTFANLGDQVTVKAIAYNNANIGSVVDVATYTYTTKVINVEAPFFSPLEGSNGGYSGVYYGEQTLEIATETENADIYYVIEDVTGTTPPSSVSDPSKSSTLYTGPYTMQVGHSYRVKAIAYIGDFASQISEGYYIIQPFQGGTHVYQNLKDFNDNCPTGVSATFVNPVQVVYMSTYTNKDGAWPEFCYVRDNTDYACVYFGKRNTGSYEIFEMGDWIDGSQIAGTTNIWDRNFHIQLGTQSHSAITSWPSATIGHSEILPEEITNAVIVAGTAEGSNSWGHYVHLRNTTLRNVQDYDTDDPKHTGLINDGTADAYYYDKFYRWSAGTCTYDGHDDVINHIGDYDQDFFTTKQNAGATFDVYGIVDYYKPYNPPFEMCPIDFLWVYKPVITPATNLNCTSQQVVDITVETPEWDGATTPTIYYKTDDMEDWEEFIGPFIVNSDTHVQAYAELPSTFEDMMRSDIVEATYEFTNIKDPIITSVPDENVILVQTGNESVTVTIETNPESPDAITLYTTNGEVPTLDNGTEVENGQVTLDPITETTTVTAISYIEVSDGQGGTTILWSNPVTETYTFVKSNGIVYDLVHAVETGKVYVIVNKDANMGMSVTQNATNRASTGVMFTDNTKEHVYGNDELALFVLESAGAGRYYFKNINGGGYLTVTTNDNANLMTTGTADTYARATVAIGANNADVDKSYPATITFNYDGTNRYLRYFAKGRTFTTNADATLNEDVFLYGTSATPLAVIESEEIASPTNQVTVSDDLIGTWAVDGNGKKYLWAKDMGYSIDKTTPVTGQTDYVKDILGFQHRDWDQSNWVIIDFANSELEPGDYVGKKIAGGTLTGKYVEGKNNGGNYRIVLDSQITPIEDADAAKYPGYGEAVPANADPNKDNHYVWYYNTYGPANFLDANLNAPYGNGYVAPTTAYHAGEKLFFMNPKIQEVVRISAVYAGNNKFTVYTPSLADGVNGWGLTGGFNVAWDYNTNDGSNFGYVPDLTDAANYSFIFHAVVVKNATGGSSNAPRRASADQSSPISDKYTVYPLDFKGGSGNMTAVRDLQGDKTVESVRYYNVMGMESEQPFEGINIVVTRYNDGSVSTMKVLR